MSGLRPIQGNMCIRCKIVAGGLALYGKKSNKIINAT